MAELDLISRFSFVDRWDLNELLRRMCGHGYEWLWWYVAIVKESVGLRRTRLAMATWNPPTTWAIDNSSIPHSCFKYVRAGSVVYAVVRYACTLPLFFPMHWLRSCAVEVILLFSWGLVWLEVLPVGSELWFCVT
ncbi:hypothetical protein QCA50_006808 [Cerrena zonata]|uniref:Uncharacterized protein n=1 Tax=Cerrena zonata TaxID=2478898 RepID=A0AAW0GKJ5_9APHY